MLARGKRVTVSTFKKFIIILKTNFVLPESRIEQKMENTI